MFLLPHNLRLSPPKFVSLTPVHGKVYVIQPYLCDKVVIYGTSLVSSTLITDIHNNTKILLEMAFNVFCLIAIIH